MAIAKIVREAKPNKRKQTMKITTHIIRFYEDQKHRRYVAQCSCGERKESHDISVCQEWAAIHDMDAETLNSNAPGA